MAISLPQTGLSNVNHIIHTYCNDLQGDLQRLHEAGLGISYHRSFPEKEQSATLRLSRGWIGPMHDCHDGLYLMAEVKSCRAFARPKRFSFDLSMIRRDGTIHWYRDSLYQAITSEALGHYQRQLMTFLNGIRADARVLLDAQQASLDAKDACRKAREQRLATLIG